MKTLQVLGGIRRLTLCVAAGLLVLVAGGAQASQWLSRGADSADRPATLTVLVDLTRKTGARPYAGLVLGSNGKFYGVTEDGGQYNRGVVFRMNPSGGLKVLHSFTGGDDGGVPSATLVEGSDGALYGTSRGIASRIVFRITRRGMLDVLHTMDADQSEGDGPPSQMLQARDGYLYGTTPWGGTGSGGVLYRVSPSGDFAVVAHIGTDQPYWPAGQPLEGDDGNFYLTCESGGSHGYGGLLRISPSGTITTMYEFTSADQGGANPSSGLVYDAAHEYMHGLTSAGFYKYRDGVVEMLAALPALTRELALAPDGVHFYAIAGSWIHSMTADGQVKAIAEVGWTGLREKLAFDKVGAIYGTTEFDGAHRKGTIFKVTDD